MNKEAIGFVKGDEEYAGFTSCADSDGWLMRKLIDESGEYRKEMIHMVGFLEMATAVVAALHEIDDILNDYD